jgi:hypothetical protein
MKAVVAENDEHLKHKGRPHDHIRIPQEDRLVLANVMAVFA